MEQALILTQYPISQDEGERITQTIALLAESGIGFFQYHTSEETQSGAIVHYWLGAFSDQLKLVEDDHLSAAYLSLEIEDKHRASQIISFLKSRLSFIEMDELVQDAISHSSDDSAWVKLGLAVHDYNRQVADLIITGLHHKEAEVRKGAVQAAILSKWKELVGPLAKARVNEKDEMLGNLLAYAERRCTTPGE